MAARGGTEFGVLYRNVDPGLEGRVNVFHSVRGEK